MDSAKIIFNDGSVIECDMVNGAFVTDTKPTIPIDMTNVTIERHVIIAGEDLSSKEILDHTKYVQYGKIENRYHWSIQWVTDQEWSQIQIENAICELSEVL